MKQSIVEYNNFRSRKASRHLSNAEKQIETALVNSKHLSVATGDIEKDYAEVLSSYRKSVGQHLRYFREGAEELEKLYNTLDNELKSLNEQIDQQKSRIDKVVSDFQSQVSSLHQQNLNEFQEKQNSRDSQFGEFLDEIRLNSESEINQLKSEVDEKIEQIDEESTYLLGVLQEKKEEALRLVGIVANTGMAGGYLKIANQAMWTKRVWQTLTVLSLLGMIYFSIKMYQATLDNGTVITLGVAGIRIFVTIVIALFAGYSAKQADTNSKAERRNRQMEIELSSIDMFLAKFEEEEQLGIKKKLSDKYFGNLPTDKSVSESKSLTTIIGHLEKIIHHLIEK